MSQSCYHCSEIIPAGFKAETMLAGECRQFCCYGCLAIADTIISGGLESFYQHRTRSALKTEEISQVQLDELGLYDDQELQGEFVATVNDLSEASLSIKGITCAACIWLLEKEVNQLSGVDSFSINHTTHKARIVWKMSELKLSQVLVSMRQLGYKARPYQEDQARQSALKEKRNALLRIAVAGIATMQNMMFSMPLYFGVYSGIDSEFITFFRWVSLLMCTPVVFFSAWPFICSSFRDIKTRHLTMDVPIAFAILAAYISSAWITLQDVTQIEMDVYFDSVCMFTFFILLGRFIEMQARHKHLNSETDITQLLPSTALIRTIDKTGEYRELCKPAHKLEIGDILIIRQGQIAAADGKVIEGESRVDESALTGEFFPISKSPGSNIIGGSANIENTLFVETTTIPKRSRISAIIRLLDKAHSEKPKTVEIADKIASHFISIVLLATIIIGATWYYIDPDKAFMIILSVLVVTCPCALSLATPTAITKANTVLQGKGFLVTQSHAFEAMTQTTDIIFDKTGTLTEGKFRILSVQSYHDLSKDQVLEIAAALEHHSNHPIAHAFSSFYKMDAFDVTTHLGSGISGKIFDERLSDEPTHYQLGNLSFINLSNPATSQDNKQAQNETNLTIYLSDSKRILASFTLSDTIRNDTQHCIDLFKAQGITTHMLSGDIYSSVEHTADTLGIQSFKAEQSPEQKLDYISHLQAEGKQVAMVGDGINDLPVLSGAAFSIAMGQACDITKLNSDAILLNNNLSVINQAFQTARQTRKIIKQNISWAIIYNLCMLPLAALGLVPPYFAVLGMSTSSLFVVFNSLRIDERSVG